MPVITFGPSWVASALCAISAKSQIALRVVRGSSISTTPNASACPYGVRIAWTPAILIRRRAGDRADLVKAAGIKETFNALARDQLALSTVAFDVFIVFAVPGKPAPLLELLLHVLPARLRACIDHVRLLTITWLAGADRDAVVFPVIQAA